MLNMYLMKIITTDPLILNLNTLNLHTTKINWVVRKLWLKVQEMVFTVTITTLFMALVPNHEQGNISLFCSKLFVFYQNILKLLLSLFKLS